MTGDLVVLTPDADIEFGLRGLFERAQAIGIRTLTNVEWIRHGQRDPGVFKTGRQLLAPYAKTHRHALIVLDHAWSGAPEPAEIERTIESRCRPQWSDRVRAVCIVPEVEVWVWSDSPHVARVLGWPSAAELRNWLVDQGHWPRGREKPVDPKSTYLAALAKQRVQRSPSNFQELGRSVGIERCQDASLARMLGILRGWFGPV